MKDWLKNLGDKIAQLWQKVLDAFKTIKWLKWVALGVAGVIVASTVLVIALSGGKDNGGSSLPDSSSSTPPTSSSSPVDSSSPSEDSKPVEKPENASNGLAYKESADGTYYVLDSIGDNKDESVWIPSMHMGKPVKEIDFNAFANATCKGVWVGKNVVKIADTAFKNCANLEKIEVDEENTAFKSVDGNLYTKDGKTLLVYACAKTEKTFTVPADVEALGAAAFAGAKNLESLSVANGNKKFLALDGHIYTIGGEEFVQYAVGNKAESFELPNTVKTIGENAFATASNLTSVKLSSVETIAKNAFYECANLKTVELNEGLKTIGEFAFYYSGLETVTIPATVEKIGALALMSMKVSGELGNYTETVALTSVTFLVTEGWSASGEPVDATSLADATVAAQLFSDMNKNAVKVWTRA